MAHMHIQTVVPGANIPYGYFDDDNVEFIRSKVEELLGREFNNNVKYDRASIIRVMLYILEQHNETVPRMNERVIMNLTNQFRNYQITINKHLRWEEDYVLSQRLYNPLYGGSLQYWQNNWKEKPIGDTPRFFFT